MNTISQRLAWTHFRANLGLHGDNMAWLCMSCRETSTGIRKVGITFDAYLDTVD